MPCSAPRNICIATSSYPRFRGDSAGIFVKACADSLRQNGHSVTILAPKDRAALPPRDADLMPIPHAFKSPFYGAGVPDNLTTSWRDLASPSLGGAHFLANVVRNIRRRAPEFDTIITHWGFPLGFVVSRTAPRLPHVIVWHSTDIFWLAKLPAPLRKRLFARDVHHWVVSRRQRKTLARLLSIKRDDIVAMPMPLEPPAPPPSAQTRSGALFVGRLVPIKNVRAAIATAYLRGLTLTVAGEGPEREKAERFASELKADVRFLGQVSDQHKWRLMYESEKLIFTSKTLANGRREGSPTVLLEAAAAKLPVIDELGQPMTPQHAPTSAQFCLQLEHLISKTA